MEGQKLPFWRPRPSANPWTVLPLTLASAPNPKGQGDVRRRVGGDGRTIVQWKPFLAPWEDTLDKCLYVGALIVRYASHRSDIYPLDQKVITKSVHETDLLQ